MLLAVACGPAVRLQTPSASSASDQKAELFYATEETRPGDRFPSPLVRGSVAGRPTLFIVDTGAQVSVVDATLASLVHLALAPATAAKDPSSTVVAIERTQRPSLALEGWGPVTDRPAAVLPLPPELTKLGIGGIVSPQAIVEHGREVLLDLVNNELRSTVAGEAEPSASFGKGYALPLPRIDVCRYEDSGFSARSLVVTATIDGIRSVIELDTGASGTFAVSDSDLGRKLSSHPNAARAKALGAAGPIETVLVTGVPLQLGSAETLGTITVMPGTRDEHCGYEGRIGIESLRSCVLVLGESGARGACGTTHAP